MGFIKKILIFFDRMNNILAFIAGAIIIFIMLSVGLDVVMRYFFKQPQIWVLEVTEYSLLFMTFLATTWLLRQEGHVKMDLLINLLKPGTRAILNIFTTALLTALFLILTWYGAKVSLEQFQYGYFTSTPLEVPTGPLMSVIPFGFFLLFIQSLRMLFKYMKEIMQSRETGE